MIRSKDQLTDPAWRHLVGLAPGGPIHVLELPSGWGIHVDVSDDPEETRPYFVTAGNCQVSVNRDELLALAADINAHFAALSAPSEPVPDGPRVAGTAEHGWTRHGHRCCDQATGPRPPRVARCGGPAICRDCAADAAVRHSPKTGTFGPRVWAMPEIPEDVKAVRDACGEVWRRLGASQRVWVRDQDDFAELAQPLVTNFGPLTEVVEEATP